jgi:KaiC/GvpD/RAD55 family RecA-like ATPase
MKVVVYQGENKITVNNVSIPNIDTLARILTEQEMVDLTMKDLQLYNFRITSTRGMLIRGELFENEEFNNEIEEGINWQKETVN